jgi:hypothetical protein
VFTLGLALLINSSKNLSLPLRAQPIVRDLSKVYKNFLALEEENRQLTAQLDEFRREYCLFSYRILL